MRYTLAGAAVLMIAVAACGSSSSNSAPTTTGATTTTTVSSTTTGSSSSTSGSGSSTSVTTTPQCSASTLTATFGNQSNGAAGTIYYPITVTNHGAACVTGGYFGVSTYSPSGAAIATEDLRQTGSGTPTITLLTGKSLTFMVGLSDVSSGPTQGPCPQVGAFHLIPPNQTVPVQLSLLNSAGQGPTITGCGPHVAVTAAQAI